MGVPKFLFYEWRSSRKRKVFHVGWARSPVPIRVTLLYALFRRLSIVRTSSSILGKSAVCSYGRCLLSSKSISNTRHEPIHERLHPLKKRLIMLVLAPLPHRYPVAWPGPLSKRKAGCAALLNVFHYSSVSRRQGESFFYISSWWCTANKVYIFSHCEP